jgi:hypothetical protein
LQTLSDAATHCVMASALPLGTLLVRLPDKQIILAAALTLAATAAQRRWVQTF